VLGRKVDNPEENFAQEAQDGNVRHLSLGALLILLMLKQPINVNVLLYRHGEI